MRNIKQEIHVSGSILAQFTFSQYCRRRMEQLRAEGARLPGLFNTSVTASVLWGFTTLSQTFTTSLRLTSFVLSWAIKVCWSHRANTGLTLRPEMLATISVTPRSSPVRVKVRRVFGGGTSGQTRCISCIMRYDGR